MGLMESILRPPLVGIDIGASGIKAVELVHSKTPRLVAYNRVALPVGAVGENGEIVERGALVKALGLLRESGVFTSQRAAVGLPAGGVTIRKISVPQMSAAELRHQLYWEAEQYLPVDVNEVNVDSAIIGPSNLPGQTTPKMDVLLVAARKDTVATYSSLAQEAGWQVSVVDSQPFALGNSFVFNFGYRWKRSAVDVASLVVDLGAGQTKLVIVEGDKTTFSKELTQGGNLCTRWIADALGLSFLEAERTKLSNPEPPVLGIIERFSATLVEEVARAVGQYTSKQTDLGLQGIYLCGGGVHLPGIGPCFEERFSIPVHPLNPIQNIAGAGRALPRQALHELPYLGAVGVGLALRQLGDSQ